MNALTLTHRGREGDLAVRSVPKPAPADGEVLVRIHAAALNHVDLHMRRSGKRIVHTLPLTLGVDGAGEVAEAGAALTRGQPVIIFPLLYCGKCRYCETGNQPLCMEMRFIGQHANGAMADYVSVPARNLVPMPRGFSYAEAACLPTAYLTAWRAVVAKAQVKAGETTLVHGIGGGVSLAMMQIANMSGARVIVTSSSDEKLARAKSLGAWAGINYRKDDVVRQTLELTNGRGVDVVLNNVGGETWSHSVRAAARGGRISICGVTDGDQPPADLRRIFIRQLQILGSTHGTVNDFRQMLHAVESGRLRPVLERIYPMADGLKAFDELAAARQFGKLVIDVSGCASSVPQPRPVAT